MLYKEINNSDRASKILDVLSVKKEGKNGKKNGNI